MQLIRRAAFFRKNARLGTSQTANFARHSCKQKRLALDTLKSGDNARRGKSSQQDQNAGGNYGRGTSGANWGSFGVPIRKESCTSHGSQPWLISTSDWMDIYI